MSTITTREAGAEDLNFIYSAWFKSWRGQPNAGTIPNHLYHDTMRVMVENLVGRGAIIKVAEANNRLLGFICYEFTTDKKPVVHYIYVKEVYKQYGVGELLRDDAFPKLLEPGFITHKCPIVLEYFDDFTWAPEIARRKDA